MQRLETIPNSVGEVFLRGQHDSGLRVLLHPRAEFTRTFAMISTHFGSLDAMLPQADGSARSLPDGVAHFLEHKLFEDEEGDVSLRFSARGASCNAATEFTRTSYQFSCADGVESNLETLLRFVQTPYFPEESVNRERGIIEQEIRMYEDDPDWRIFFQLLQAMYHEHPARIDIAGSVQSIAAIEPGILYDCHRVFYHPANMVLALSGGFDVEAVGETIDRVMGEMQLPGGQPHRRPRFPEPVGVRDHRRELKLSISRPQVCLGFKDSPMPEDPREGLQRELLSQVALDLLFSSSSKTHHRLYESGVIDDSFDASYSAEHDFAFTVLSCETDDPDAFVAAMQEAIARARRDGFEQRDFERVRKRFLGRFIRMFHSAEAVANLLITSELRGLRPDQLLPVVDSMRLDQVHARLREHLREDTSAVSILWPGDPESAPSD